MSRNQPAYKFYGRGKHSNHPNTVVHTSIQFDKVFCDSKPTAAKSAGTIGKWGITSFTSIRSATFTVGRPRDGGSRFSSLNKKRNQNASSGGGAAQKRSIFNNIKREPSPVLQPRKFFKSRNSDASNGKSVKATYGSTATKKNARNRLLDDNIGKIIPSDEETVPGCEPTLPEKPLKSSRKIVSPIADDEHDVVTAESPPRDKPPIVLRIFKGTAQLVTDSSRSPSIENDDTAAASLRNIDRPDTGLSTRNLRRRRYSPVKSPSSEEEEEDVPVISTRSRRRHSPVKSPSPEHMLTTRGRRRVKQVKEKSPTPEIPASPEPVEEHVMTPCSEPNRSPVKERLSSPDVLPFPTSPEQEPILNTRSRRKTSGVKDRSPTPEVLPMRRKRNKSSMSVSPDLLKSKRKNSKVENHDSETESIEPTKTTRSLRRRQAPSETVEAPHTSPKRVLRSTRSATTTGKLIITNLHSDNPTVYSLVNDAPVVNEPKLVKEPKLAAKEPKTGTRGRPKKQKPEESKINLSVIAEAEEIPIVDDGRAELLQLLEDNDEVEDVNEIVKPTENDDSEPRAGLKIKIKIPDEVSTKSHESDDNNGLAANSEENQPDVVELYQSTNASESHDCESSDTPGDVVGSEEDVVDSQVSQAYEVPEVTPDPSGASEQSRSLPDGFDDDFEVKPTNADKKSSYKKSVFFKNRDESAKRVAVYKHKWTDERQAASPAVAPSERILGAVLDEEPLVKYIKQPEKTFDFDDDPAVTAVKCSKRNKEFYTVVRNVKKAHQIQESGEFQEFNDDVDYILDALQDNNQIGTRCLSAITLATKCMEPAFRMHVRAHGTVTKFFKTLHDATKDQSLGLCTATVMFVLSQDRLNMDLDRESLELMLNLLESDASHTNVLEDCGLSDSQLIKTRDKVRQICEDIKAQGHAKHLNLENITVGHLSMETLLSLTSKRAGEWFKEELRELGGLEHIIKTIVECCKHVDDTANAWSTPSLEKIRKVDRCLRVLENITMQNEQNNVYLLEYQDGILIDTLIRMFKVCDYEIPLYPTDNISDKDSTGAVLRECLIANLKVLINVTHDYQNRTYGSTRIGNRTGVIESSLHVLFQVPQYIPKEEKFDIMLLTLIFLINLIENCEDNRKAIIEAKAPSDEECVLQKTREPAVKALISLFYQYEDLARNEEKKTDALLEGETTEKPPNNAPQKVHEDFIEETISMLVQNAGQNMEHTLIAAYVVILLGYLIIDNEENEKFVRSHLPEKNFAFMITVLEKFYSFMTLTASGGTVSNRGMKSTQMVIKQLIESDERAKDRAPDSAAANEVSDMSDAEQPADLSCAAKVQPVVESNNVVISTS